MTTNPIRLLVCGSRTTTTAGEYQFIHRILDQGYGQYDVIIEGEAKGADTAAKVWAYRNGVKVLPFPADWKRYGKSAGFKRNAQMLEEGKPTHVLAFTDKPLVESKGTAMMVRLAHNAGLIVHHYRTDLERQEF